MAVTRLAAPSIGKMARVSAASTSARTYRIRIGPDAGGSAHLNGDGGARQFGGVAISSLTVKEILPQ